MRSRLFRLATAGAVALGLCSVGAATASAQPLPTSSNGNPVTLVASGLNTPTSFAFGPGGAIFEGDGGSSSSSGPPNGGVFMLMSGMAMELADSPQFVAGLAWHDNALYVSGGRLTADGIQWVLLRWSGWNGMSFTHRQLLYVAPSGFDGFNGIGFGANGRLYVGVDVGLTDGNDHGPASLSPYLYDILTFNANGGMPHVFATGIRQPWQMAFPAGSNSPFVSDLGQDSGIDHPDDSLLRVTEGQNYGFPNFTPQASGTPVFQSFMPHTDVMGVAILGHRIFLSEFGGSTQPQVVSIPLAGGPQQTLLSGFVAPIVGLGIHNDRLYVGELTGDVYSVKVGG